MLTKIPIELHTVKDCALLQASLWYVLANYGRLETKVLILAHYKLTKQA